MRTNKGRAVSLPSGRLIGAGLLLSCAITVLTACGRPFYVWEAHTYVTPMSTSFNTSALGQERIVALFPATYAHLQGYIPMISHALMAARGETDPSLRLIPELETFNKINHLQLID